MRTDPPHRLRHSVERGNSGFRLRTPTPRLSDTDRISTPPASPCRIDTANWSWTGGLRRSHPRWPREYASCSAAERNVLLPFFGYWDLADFYSFIDALKVQTDGSDADHSIYQDMNGNPLAAAPNWGIYDLQTALTAWPSLGSYPAAELDCLGDINLDRRVDLDDILLMIHLWGMAGGDANGDDQTDVEDLLVILANFDQECP